MAIQGSCLCGTVRYEVDGPFTAMLSCHCSMCRKHHGAPFAGTLDGDPGIRVQGHMFVGSKAPWYVITDALPQYEAYPPSLGDAKPVERPAAAAAPGTTAGKCLCGDVAYEITGAAVAMYQCHCSRCRKGRAAAHGANLFYKAEDFRWTRGESLVVDYKLPAAARFGLAFCRQCGGSTPRVAGGTVVVPAGALDTDPDMRPLAHIFVASKAPWFEITDTIPQMAEAPPPPRAAR